MYLDLILVEKGYVFFKVGIILKQRVLLNIIHTLILRYRNVPSGRNEAWKIYTQISVYASLRECPILQKSPVKNSELVPQFDTYNSDMQH